MRKTLGRRAVWQQRSGTQPQPHKDTRAFGLGWGTWPSDGNVHFCNVVCSISAREITKNKPNNLWFLIPHLYKESKTGGAIQYKGSKRNPVKGLKTYASTQDYENNKDLDGILLEYDLILHLQLRLLMRSGWRQWDFKLRTEQSIKRQFISCKITWEDLSLTLLKKPLNSQSLDQTEKKKQIKQNTQLVFTPKPLGKWLRNLRCYWSQNETTATLFTSMAYFWVKIQRYSMRKNQFSKRQNFS